MPKQYQEHYLSLLERDSTRESLRERMRRINAGLAALADNEGFPAADASSRVRRPIGPQGARARKAWSWAWKTAMAAMLLGGNLLMLGEKDLILAKLGYQGVPSLPEPKTALGPDEQALYWTYALYDFKRFQQHFGVSGYYAVPGTAARKKLQDLLPKVGQSTLGEISAYTSVAFYRLPGDAQR